MLFMITGHLDSDEIQYFNGRKDFLTFLCFPIGLCLGNILAIKWRRKGGFVTTISLIGLFLFRPDLILVPVFLLLGLPSILMLFFHDKNNIVSDHQ